MEKNRGAPLLVLPVDTQVVTRKPLPQRGGLERPRESVGVVVKALVDGRHAYRVRFPDGEEVSLHRDELSIRSHEQGRGLRQAEMPELYQFVIYRCVIGSRAYGLAEAGSDTDRRGIYLPPAELHWSLYGVPEQLENDERQESYWEL